MQSKLKTCEDEQMKVYRMRLNQLNKYTTENLAQDNIAVVNYNEDTLDVETSVVDVKKIFTKGEDKFEKEFWNYTSKCLPTFS